MVKQSFNSWNNIKCARCIDYIEDPIVNIELSKEHFEETYMDILHTLNADSDCYDSCMDYYFEIHPLRRNVLVFRSEEHKTEFYEIGLKQNSVPSFESICSGNYDSNLS